MLEVVAEVAAVVAEVVAEMVAEVARVVATKMTFLDLGLGVEWRVRGCSV